jgi:hypothetical protein
MLLESDYCTVKHEQDARVGTSRLPEQGRKKRSGVFPYLYFPQLFH